jgi:NIPSNAP
MYVEECMYTLHPGTAPEYLNYYQTHGMKVQLKHLPHMVGYYVTEVGTLNMIVHMWAYESLDQRERCRAAMSADPDWQAYTAKIRPLMKRQETRIMKCAPFFVDRLKRMLAAVK